MGWSSSAVTAVGIDLLNESLAGHTLSIDRAVGGAGAIDPEELVLATDVTEQKQTFKLLGIEDIEGGKRIGIQITNEGVTERYILHQIAMFAKLEYQDSYYMIAIMQDDRGVEIPTQAETPDFLFEVYAVIAISNDAHITINVDAKAVVSAPYLEQRLENVIDQHNQDPEAHLDIREAIKGISASSIGAVQAPLTAKVGQIIVVKAVDKDGKPTEWEAVNRTIYLAQPTAPEDKTILWIDTANSSIIKYHNGTSWVPTHSAWAE